jgi:hypothetical protein
LIDKRKGRNVHDFHVEMREIGGRLPLFDAKIPAILTGVIGVKVQVAYV